MGKTYTVWYERMYGPLPSARSELPEHQGIAIGVTLIIMGIAVLGAPGVASLVGIVIVGVDAVVMRFSSRRLRSFRSR